MKKYFFGYLFVKLAKLLAILALVTGLGYCLWKYGQAHLAAESVAYRSSDFLQSQLARLTSVARSTHNIVEAFVGKETLGLMEEPTFPGDISSNGDFEVLTKELAKTDQNRGQLKQAVISRFDGLVAEIEEKLRATHKRGPRAPVQQRRATRRSMGRYRMNANPNRQEQWPKRWTRFENHR